MKWNEVEPGVFYADRSPVSATDADLRRLETQALCNPRGRARLCAHPSPTDSLHEMLICLTRNGYIQPHRHLKTESALVLRGACDLVLFDERGEIVDVLPLGDSSSGRTFFVRLSLPVYHTYLIRTDYLLFLETTPGPFDRRMTEHAPWAPAETGPIESYQQELQTRVAHWHPGGAKV